MSINQERALRRTLLPHVDTSLRGSTVKDPGEAALLWFPYNEGGRWGGNGITSQLAFCTKVFILCEFGWYEASLVASD
jgi:hypothetical protein